MRDSNPHAREQLILSQPCLPFHQFPVNNMVGAAWFEHAMIITSAPVTIAPLCAGLCIPVPPSAYKIPNQNLEKYSGVLAPTSSMFISCSLLCLIERAMYRALWNCSLGRKAAYPLVTAAVRYCHEPLLDGNVCRTTQYGQSKSWLSLTACLSIHDQQDSTLLL